MSRADAAAPAAVFAALGDPTRLALLTRLSAGPARSITELSSGADITRQAVTRHLEVLEAAGLVSRARAGRESRFAYRAEPVDEAKAYLEAVGARWDEALARLKAMVED
jgi:DNA-binding transcriptional ArsR family regulator